jgi:hypothetical protein
MDVLTFPAGARPDDLQVDLYDRLSCEVVAPQLLKSWKTPSDVYTWMENLYLKKGGSDTASNCWSVRLTAEDLDALEEAVRTDNLTGLPGVTFCEPHHAMEQDEEAISFVAMARRALADRLIVFFHVF